MNDGVKILLERMKTNPEEFVVEEGVVGKWDNIVRAYESALNPEDAKAYKDARNALLQQQFTEKVLEGLVDPKPLKDSEIPIRIGQMSAMPLAGTTQGLYSNGISGNPTLIAAQKYQMDQMKLHLDAHREAIKTTSIKKHKTIFGRLFNYQ